MGWKSKGSRSWTNVSKWPGVGRAQRWPFSKSTADAYYDEGDITTHISNPVWRTEPVGPTDREEHDPCGYWQGEAPRYYTTLLYPLEVLDEIDGVVLGIDGIFKTVFHFQDYLEEIEGQEEFVEGIFRTVFRTYEYTESIEGDPDFISCEFRQIMRSYEMEVESLEAEPDFVSAKHWEVVQYQNWPVESIEAATIAFESGEFYV